MVNVLFNLVDPVNFCFLYLAIFPSSGREKIYKKLDLQKQFVTMNIVNR